MSILYSLTLAFLTHWLSNELNFERSFNSFNIAGSSNKLNLNKLSNLFLSNFTHTLALLEI